VALTLEMPMPIYTYGKDFEITESMKDHAAKKHAALPVGARASSGC